MLQDVGDIKRAASCAAIYPDTLRTHREPMAEEFLKARSNDRFLIANMAPRFVAALGHPFCCFGYPVAFRSQQKDPNLC